MTTEELTLGTADRRGVLEKSFVLLGPFLGLLLVGALFAALAPDRFLTAYNLKTIAVQTVIVALGAIGMTYVMISGGIDLSVGSVIALSSVMTAVMLEGGASPTTSLAVGVATGAAAGACNGVLVTSLGVVPFIVTLGTMGVARGTAKYLADERTVHAPATWLTEIMTKTPTPPWLVVAWGVWITVVLAVLMSIVLRRTVFGAHVFAVGSNEATARLCGIRVNRVKVVVYAVGGLFAGLAGAMNFSRLTVGDPTTAIGAELDIIAAVVIGGGSLSGGRGGILGSLLGALLMAVLANGCTLTGVPTYVQEMVIGAIIVLAVALDRLRVRREH
jgi:ribose transport system permease protein